MKLLVVDDHPVLRLGLSTLLEQEIGALVLHAHDAAEALRVVGCHPDLDAILLDLNLPGVGGMLAIQEIGHRSPATPIVVLSSSEAPHDVRRAMALGALGYIPKSASPATLVAAVRFVLAGNQYVPPFLVSDVTPASTSASPILPREPARLTERQIAVLKMMSEGLSNKAIGLELALSEKTVKGHVTAIFKALDVVSRMQAVTAARQMHLL